ncbi:MAG: hypothetical protein HY241_12355 [Actinobacteria bacterium]|nr:hypothetical protein [Actinomycetota bacterium]
MSQDNGNAAGTAGWRAAVAPPAAGQLLTGTATVLDSSSSGVVVERVAQVRAGHRAEAVSFARETADRVNTTLAGSCTAFVFEQTFGVRDRLHLLLHMASLDGYYLLRGSPDLGGLGAPDTWNEHFAEGSITDTVLLPQFWGMYGTRVDGKLERESDIYRSPAPVGLPPARQQTTQPDEQILHSANAGIVMHRSTQIRYDFRSEARQFGREVAESINKNLPGECTVFVYEEAFGTADRLHWLIHLRDLSTYLRLLTLHVRDEEVRDIYFRDRLPPAKGGGTWARMFVAGSMVDVALTALR